MQSTRFETIIALSKLMRFDKPIGIYLLLWPTLWTLWMVYHGFPPLSLLLIFTAGCVIMRAAGCVINDIADRDFDKHVWRTKSRVLASGEVNLAQAVGLLIILLLLAVVLLCFLPIACWYVALLAVITTLAYPFCKRVTHLPQIVLGIAFSYSVLMVYFAAHQPLTITTLLLLLTAWLWPIAYDTMYAMADQVDDVAIGIKSTAILFGKYDKAMVFVLQCSVILLLLMIGWINMLKWPYYLGLLIATIHCLYQQRLIKDRHPIFCFNAFKDNAWLGFWVYLGIVLSFLIK